MFIERVQSRVEFGAEFKDTVARREECIMPGMKRNHVCKKPVMLLTTVKSGHQQKPYDA